MTQLISQSRFKETFRDIFLTQIEFLEVVNLMDNSFCKFKRKKNMATNRKYSMVLSNLVEDYLNEQVKLNEKYIHNISRIQKKFLDSESSKQFLEDFFEQVEELSLKIQKLKEESNTVDYDDKNDFYDRIQNSIAEFFPISALTSNSKGKSTRGLTNLIANRSTKKPQKQHSFGGLPQNFNIAPAQPAKMNTMGDRKMSTGKFNTRDERQEPTRSAGNFNTGLEPSSKMDESQVVNQGGSKRKGFNYQDFKTPSRNIENRNPNIMLDGSRRRNRSKMSFCTGLDRTKGDNSVKNYASLARSLHVSKSPTLDRETKTPIFDSQIHHPTANLDEEEPDLPEANLRQTHYNSPNQRPFGTHNVSNNKSMAQEGSPIIDQTMIEENEVDVMISSTLLTADGGVVNTWT